MRDTDRGAAALLQRLLEAGVVKIGILEKDFSKSHKDESGEASDLTVGEVGEIHEFGLGVPRRSFLADWYDEKRDEIKTVTVKGARALVKGSVTGDEALNQIGSWAVGSIQTRIAGNIPPILAPSTIARKGSSVALINTNQLRSSISHEVKK